MQFIRPVDGALFMYEQHSAKVFPLKTDAKTPAFSGWQKWAERCSSQLIAAYAQEHPAANWGISCEPSGFAVVDIDVKKTDGKKNFVNLLRGRQLPPTLRVKTPSGGYHIYFSGSMSSAANALAPGVDVKSRGGYVVGPGSRLDGAGYEIDVVETIQPWPGFLQPTEKPKKTLTEPVLEGERNTTLTRLAGVMRAQGIGHGAIEAALLEINADQLESPLPEQEVRVIAASIARYAPNIATAAAEFTVVAPTTMPFRSGAAIDPAKIAPRDWIMRHRYVGRFVSVIIAPGGVGKSTLTMLDAAAVATGQPYSGFDVPLPGRVWLYNTEDPMEELERRLAALGLYHRISDAALGNILISASDEHPFTLARAGKDGVAMNDALIKQVVAFIREQQIRLFIVDPFVRTHEVSENDNMQIDRVMWGFKQIANATGCAVGVVHHTRKRGQEVEPTMDMARGASACVDASRVSHVLSSMTEEEAEQFGIPQNKRSWYVRLDNAKANLSPPAEAADWYQKVSVALPNGDEVGVLQLMPLASMAEQRKTEMAEEHVADIARVLAEIMSVGSRMPVSEVYNLMTTDPAWSHLFNAYTSARRGTAALMNALRKEPVDGDKMFCYEQTEDGRVKHWVCCKSFTDPFTDAPGTMIESTEAYGGQKMHKSKRPTR